MYVEFWPSTHDGITPECSWWQLQHLKGNSLGKGAHVLAAPCLSFYWWGPSSEPHVPPHWHLYTSAGSSSSTMTKQQILVRMDPNNCMCLLFVTSMAFLCKDNFFLWIFSMMLWNCEKEQEAERTCRDKASFSSEQFWPWSVTSFLGIIV